LRTKVETGPALQVNEQLATSRLLFLAQFLETWIVPQRIEHWIQPEFAVRGAVRDLRGSFQLLDSEVALTRPGTDHDKKIRHTRAMHCAKFGRLLRGKMA
jgi:hypothetical protein